MSSVTQPEIQQKSLETRLTLRYTVALMIIACVMLVSYTMIVRQISSNEKDAHIINISGMQRMLSQRIALMAREIYHADGQDQAEIYFEKMKSVTARMKENHAALTSGDLDREYDEYTPSPEIQKMYFGDNGINDNVLEYTGFAQEFLDIYEADGLEGIRNSDITRRIVEIARNGLLAQLNDAVFQYEQESYSKIQRFKRIEMLFFMTGLVILLAEIIFIFRPMVRSVTKNVEDLERANTELLEFSYRMSHDLRAPVLSSRGLIDVANEGLKSGDTDVAKEAMAHITKSMARLDDLIADILNLTKMKMVDIEKEPVDMSDLIKSVTDNLSHMPNFNVIRLTTDVSLKAPVTVKKIFLQQSLENLLSNAVKYYNPDAAEPYIDVSVSQKGKKCVVSIKDNGVGIPEKYHNEVFGIFKRFHSDKAFGSGLGLYLVRQNMKSLNGSVEFIPMDQGSHFKLTFPLV